MTEESAWQTFSLIKKKEENKSINNKDFSGYREKFNRINDNRFYDTDTTDSDDSEYYRKELKMKNNVLPLDTKFITPPKSNIDSNHSSPIDHEMNSNSNKLNNKRSFSDINKDNIIKNKSGQNGKEKGMESAWTKFINDNPSANKSRELNKSPVNKFYKIYSDDENLETLEILENLSVNSINSLTSLASMNSTGSRGSRRKDNKDGMNNLEEYTILTNNNKDTPLKVKELSSIESVNLEDRSYTHSRIPSTFLENSISAWRNRSIKEIEEVEQDTKNDNDNNFKSSNSSINFDSKISDSISAWKIESSKSIRDILKNYNIKQAIGKGYCGTIFKGVNEKTGQAIAIKTESVAEKNKHLEEEYAIYQRLYGLEGMPHVLYYGRLEKDNIMVMELLGPSIEDLFRLCQRRFTMKTICMIAKQLITRLEKVHERGIVYRDIKPENFLIGCINYSKPISNKFEEGEEVYLKDGTLGRPPVSTVYLADFGLSEFYKNPVTKRYVPHKKKPPCGTPRYMSLNTHRCDQQTPRDDLEALGYCLLYLCFGGRLPWMGITAKTPEAMIMSIGRRKASISIDQLCKSLPHQFGIYLNYVRRLGFYDKPHYHFLRELFDDILEDMGQEDDGEFDWIAPMRYHQEQKAKKQKMKLEKEKNEKKRKYSISNDTTTNNHSNRNINGPCKKQTFSSIGNDDSFNNKRVHQTITTNMVSNSNSHSNSSTSISPNSHSSSYSSNSLSSSNLQQQANGHQNVNDSYPKNK